MERMELEAEVRPAVNKGGRRRMRLEDKVPAVIYGRSKETQSLAVEGRPLRQLLAAGGSNVLIDLKIKQRGKKTKQETVMFKDIQRHLLQKDRLMHVDFIRISMTDRIEVGVQINFTGEPAGVKEGGILQLLAREVTIKCLPADIPDHLDVDLSALNIGESVTAGSLRLAEGLELVTPPEEPLAQVLAPVMEEEVPAEAVEEAEAAEPAKEEAPSTGEES